MNPIRHAQVASRLKDRLAEVLANEMKDPRTRFITVTRVSLATDLTQCSVFYSVLGDEGDKSAVAHLLEHAKGFLERQVRRAVRSRVSPRLFFKFDESIEGAIKLGQKIDAVIAEDRAKAAAAGREPGGETSSSTPGVEEEAPPSEP